MTNLFIFVYLCLYKIVFVENTTSDDGDHNYTTYNSDILDNDKSEEEWLETALRDIAYYLRNYKFNEWDRRYYEETPAQNLIGFYKALPTPRLSSIHWEVHKNCHKDFYKCITYLHSIVNTAPFTRSDDITTSLTEYSTTTNMTLIQMQNNECKKAILYTQNTGLPFSGPDEKFYWRTSASYYMCWYTMKRIPAISMLGDSCDNFANCLDTKLGKKNRDPRSDDKLSFGCASYSFCPDPCCPIKHVYKRSQCYNSAANPCYFENIHNDISIKQCRFYPENNQNLEHIMENRWNVTCYCQQPGFTWDSQFGMCVDINECTTKQHNCDVISEDCLNLPGACQCVCKWGYVYNNVRQKCAENRLFLDAKLNETRITRQLHLMDIFESILKYIF